MLLFLCEDTISLFLSKLFSVKIDEDCEDDDVDCGVTSLTRSEMEQQARRASKQKSTC